MNASDTKNWAQRIVKSSFNEILTGKFQVPSQEELEIFIKDNFFYESFDEYQMLKRIRDFHPGWSEAEIADEFERQKRKHDRDNRDSLKRFAKGTIEEIENLIKNLDRTIMDWKVSNL